MTISKAYADYLKERFNSLMNLLKKLESLNSDLLAEVTIEKDIVRLLARSKSDPSCQCYLCTIFACDGAYFNNEINRAKDVVDVLINLNSRYECRKAVLGKLVSR